ncbi:MAG: cytochrome c [Alphaproteobacteria bacterium]|nr:cytochrome c [Alphaproteobacteria bacterium]HJP20598.1 cytochrome c [Alphaproteobacteria bacterium]
MTWRFGLSLVASISAALLLTGGALADSAISQPRQSELDNLFEQDCGSCHGLTRRGGLGSPLLPEALADKSDEVLVEIILDGLPGTAMPPWRPFLTVAEASYIVGLMRKPKP